jgi:hypothetical protein
MPRSMLIHALRAVIVELHSCVKYALCESIHVKLLNQLHDER